MVVKGTVKAEAALTAFRVTQSVNELHTTCVNLYLFQHFVLQEKQHKRVR